MKKSFYWVLFIFFVAVTSMVSCKVKTQNEREKIRVDYPDAGGYVWVYKDDGTVAEDINIFERTASYSFFNLETSMTRKGWDRSQTGVLNARQNIIMPPFYGNIHVVWDPVSRETFFLGTWKGTSTMDVYDMSGNRINRFRYEKYVELQKLDAYKNRRRDLIKTEWAIRNFRSKL